MFDDPFSMVVGIVLICAVASVVRAKYQIQRDESGKPIMPHDPEADRLREEVKALKDRVAVLERLATDSSSALDREFELLRKRDDA